MFGERLLTVFVFDGDSNFEIKAVSAIAPKVPLRSHHQCVTHTRFV